MVQHRRLYQTLHTSILRCGLIAALSGCQNIPNEEYAWQALHVADVMQTRQIAQNPACFSENGVLTQSVIGRHPSEKDVAAWGIATAGLHAGITVLLESTQAPQWLRATWAAVTLTTTTYAVTHNFSEGLGLDSANCR